MLFEPLILLPAARALCASNSSRGIHRPEPEPEPEQERLSLRVLRLMCTLFDA